MISRLGRNVAALGLVSLLTDMSSEMIYPLLPVFLTVTLGASAATLGIIEGIAESTAGLLKYFSGWWSDRSGSRKPLVVMGYGIASIARPLVAFASTATHVLMVRFADRVGKGIRTSPRDALIADSVDEKSRGLAYGFHRAADHTGALLGPLIAFVLLSFAGLEMRTVFLLAAIPAALSIVVLVTMVRDPRADRNVKTADDVPKPNRLPMRELGPGFWKVLGVIFLFTLGSSTDAFLLLRAADLGVSAAQIPILWAVFHVVKSASSTPGGALSDRIGRRSVVLAGWIVYAATYVGFAFASSATHVWLLFLVYGLYYGLVEGTEKALVADIVPANLRGTAFGAYNLAISAAALPASVIFGLIWTSSGAASAFIFGAILAALASVALLLVVPARRQT